MYSLNLLVAIASSMLQSCYSRRGQCQSDALADRYIIGMQQWSYHQW